MIKRTFNTDLVRSVIGDKELFKRTGEYVPIDAYDPETQKDLVYLSVEVDNVIIGLVVFHVFNHPVCYQGHVNYLPEYWGQHLERHTKEAISWMFENTECRKIVALIPDHYPEILLHAKRAGMKKEGYLINSVIADGKMDNLTLLGIEK